MSLLLFRPAREAEAPEPPPSPPSTEGVIAGVLVELNFADPTDPPEWVDVSAYLRDFSYAGGASDEMEQPQAGTASVRLGNQDGRFDPANASSPYWPNVVPMRGLRISALSGSGTAFTMRQSHVNETDVLRGGVQTFALWTGFIENWPLTWDISDNDAEVRLEAMDAFGMFNLSEFVWGYRNTPSPGPDDWPCGLPSGNVTPANGPPFIPDELAGERIHRVLDCLGWPEDMRVIDDGTVSIMGSDQEFGGSTNIPVSDGATSHIRSVGLTEGGLVFVDPGGRVRFIDADHLPTGSVDDYGDVDPELRYGNIAMETGVYHLWNKISVSASSVLATIEAEDATSIARFGERGKAISILSAIEGGGSVNSTRAPELLAKFKNPRTRITQFQFRPRTGYDFRRLAVRQIGDVVTAHRRPRNAGAIEQVSRILSMSVVSQNKFDWLFTVTLAAL